jgi:hypothetical protein
MRSFSTCRVNALQQIFVLLFSASALVMPTTAICQISESNEVQFNIPKENSPRSTKAPIGAEKNSSETADSRLIQILQINPTLLQFEFPKFSYFWLTSEQQYKNFWKENSKLSGDAPALKLNWKTDSLLAVFWESKDAIVRIPTFMGAEEVESDNVKTLRLNFGQNTPCLGIISGNSPAMFLVVDNNFNDLDSVALRTETTKSTGCF